MSYYYNNTMRELCYEDFAILVSSESEETVASDISSFDTYGGPPDLEDSDDDVPALEGSDDDVPALEDLNDDIPAPESKPIVGLRRIEPGSQEWCNESMIGACANHDCNHLRMLLQEHGHLIKASYSSWCAWKECVRLHRQDLCELMIEHFGSRIIYDSWLIRKACLKNQRETAMFLLDLLKGECFTDCVALEAASRKGDIAFVNKVLDSWKMNDEVDGLSSFFAAISGAIDGDQEALFDSVLARFKAIKGSIFNPAYFNRSFLIIVAKKQDYVYFQKAIVALDYAWHEPHDCYMSLGTTGIRKTCYHAKSELVKLCCSTKDPRFTDALLESIGSTDLARVIRWEDTESACKNGHTSIARLFTLKGDPKSVLTLFTIAAKANRFDVCRVFLDKLGTSLVAEIDAGALALEPTVKDLLQEYFLGMAIKYGHGEPVSTKPIRPWFCYDSMKANACTIPRFRHNSLKANGCIISMPQPNMLHYRPSQMSTCGLKLRNADIPYPVLEEQDESVPIEQSRAPFNSYNCITLQPGMGGLAYS